MASARSSCRATSHKTKLNLGFDASLNNTILTTRGEYVSIWTECERKDSECVSEERLPFGFACCHIPQLNLPFPTTCIGNHLHTTAYRQKLAIGAENDRQSTQWVRRQVRECTDRGSFCYVPECNDIPALTSSQGATV